MTEPLSTEVLIVGAGPVGLFLACRLAQLNIDFLIVDKRLETVKHSRSIGIHPPSLERLAELGLAEAFVAKGVKIAGGQAFANTRPLGRLSFEHCPEPFNFILTLPQFETEAILEDALLQLRPKALLRGLELTYIKQEPSLQARFRTAEGTKAINANYLIACDGKDSKVRELAGIPVHGEAYPDAYLMGDFADTTELGSDAGIYLTDAGLVESFPLPEGVRRWVAKTDSYIQNPNLEVLASIIDTRLGHKLTLETNTMLSSFGVQHFLASQFVKGRILLAGDAAHVLSPIGGQGMNLGWLDAWEAANTLEAIVKKDKSPHASLQDYALKRKKVARTAIARAAFNMQLGRKTPFAPLKYAFVKLMLNSPLERLFARIFTMRWL
jgi:2-polyprenyl-6-methoxyphenol hydroxylase-like FAD-dependent oxidoreductase